MAGYIAYFALVVVAGICSKRGALPAIATGICMGMMFQLGRTW